MSDRRPAPEPVIGESAPEEHDVGPRRPQEMSGPVSITSMGELFQNLDRYSTEDAWLTGARIQFVHDKHLRDLDWWFRTIWKKNGCTASLTKIKSVALENDWEGLRSEMWNRVFYVIEERFAEEQAEHALTVVNRLKAIQAVMLEKLSPRIVTTEDANGNVIEDLELKIQPKSYEGMVRALKDIMEMHSLSTQTALELIAGSRGTDDLASDISAAQQREDSKEENSPLKRLRSMDAIRRVANTLALEDGKTKRSR